MKKSKPEEIPEDLQELVATAYELAELNAAGVKFEYPDGLSSHEWMTLTALGRGRAKADATDRKRREKKKR